jgi:hypothetical protein
MKAREKKQSDVQLYTLCLQLKLHSTDGKDYKTDERIPVHPFHGARQAA